MHEEPLFSNLFLPFSQPVCWYNVANSCSVIIHWAVSHVEQMVYLTIHYVLSFSCPQSAAVQPSLPLSQESHQSQPMPAPPGIQDFPEAGYQMIGASKPQTPVSPPITPHSIPAQSFPIGTYAEINDPQLESIRQQAQANQSCSEMRSRTPSELQGNVTPHDQLVSEDEMDADVATYAQVDMHKKRESRRKKRAEQTRTTPTPDHAPQDPLDQGMDSWVWLPTNDRSQLLSRNYIIPHKILNYPTDLLDRSCYYLSLLMTIIIMCYHNFRLIHLISYTSTIL